MRDPMPYTYLKVMAQKPWKSKAECWPWHRLIRRTTWRSENARVMDNFYTFQGFFREHDNTDNPGVKLFVPRMRWGQNIREFEIFQLPGNILVNPYSCLEEIARNTEWFASGPFPRSIGGSSRVFAWPVKYQGTVEWDHQQAGACIWSLIWTLSTQSHA